MTTNWQTPDEVIARNVTRFRERKGWAQTVLADRLGLSKDVVLLYEGRRKGRSQRPFRWSELVELCYALDCTLYELVFPNDPDTKVDLVTDSGLGKSLKTEMPLMISPDGRAGPRSSELGLRLFGVPGDELLEADDLKEDIEKATEMRRAIAQEIQDKWAEYGRQLEVMFPGDGTKRILWEHPDTGQTTEVIIGLTPPDEQEKE